MKELRNEGMKSSATVESEGKALIDSIQMRYFSLDMTVFN